MANTKAIQNTKTLSYPQFPNLEVGKTRRCITKHLSNTALYFYPDEVSLLYFLTYQTSADNTFKYTTKLLQQYLKAVEYLQTEYKREKLGACNIIYARRTMKKLIEQGYVLQTGKAGTLMVSPLLTYQTDVVNPKQYRVVMNAYQASPHKITEIFVTLVKQFLESKKKNYKYGKRR